MVAIVRYVWRNNGNPKLAFLSPCIKKDYEVGIVVQCLTNRRPWSQSHNEAHELSPTIEWFAPPLCSAWCWQCCHLWRTLDILYFHRWTKLSWHRTKRMLWITSSLPWTWWRPTSTCVVSCFYTGVRSGDTQTSTCNLLRDSQNNHDICDLLSETPLFSHVPQICFSVF